MARPRKVLGWKQLIVCETLLGGWFLTAYLVDTFGTRYIVQNNSQVFDNGLRDVLLGVVIAGHWIVCEKEFKSDGSYVEHCEPGFPFKQRIETGASVFKWFHPNLDEMSNDEQIIPPYLFLTGAKMESLLASQYASKVIAFAVYDECYVAARHSNKISPSGIYFYDNCRECQRIFQHFGTQTTPILESY